MSVPTSSSHTQLSIIKRKHLALTGWNYFPLKLPERGRGAKQNNNNKDKAQMEINLS